MALNSSGEISLSGSIVGTSIYKELETLYKPGGGTTTASISLQDKWVTALAQKSAGASVSTSELYSQSKTILSATLNANTTSGCRVGTTGQSLTVSTTDGGTAITVTTTGGLFPFTYLWTFQSGDNSISAQSSTSQTTDFAYTNLPPCSTSTATYVCVVKDLSGATLTSDSVTITLTNRSNEPDLGPCGLSC